MQREGIDEQAPEEIPQPQSTAPQVAPDVSKQCADVMRILGQ